MVADSRELRRQRGFNLAEVMIAMAMLGTVILSIITLFYLGRSNIYSGKQMTRAASVTVHANEDLGPLGAADLLSAFNITSTTAMVTSPTIAGSAYSNAIVRSTSGCTSTVVGGVTTWNCGANDVKGYLARWKGLLGSERITKGNVTLVFLPRNIASPGTDPTKAALVNVRVITEWSETRRNRNVSLDLVKFNRNQ
ncbi:MAG TPA: prepilin-type N-terminal cleavage/methylation domain-containing protein [Thermoanaerobaculia bacterium]|jgi:prepilin-type N-terminal cleavage/methylation domain-containing protein